MLGGKRFHLNVRVQRDQSTMPRPGFFLESFMHVIRAFNPVPGIDIFAIRAYDGLKGRTVGVAG